MEPRIEISPEMKIIGKRLTMSLAKNRIVELWKSFMPFRSQITCNITDDLLSVSVYQPNYFENFSPSNEFQKWAAVQVDYFDNIPTNLDSLTLPKGQYAVFDHRGLSTDNSIFQYIFTEWLPASQYALDNRPHFEILGDMYKHNDPNSEEELWIPIKAKAHN